MSRVMSCKCRRPLISLTTNYIMSNWCFSGPISGLHDMRLWHTTKFSMLMLLFCFHIILLFFVSAGFLKIHIRGWHQVVGGNSWIHWRHLQEKYRAQHPLILFGFMPIICQKNRNNCKSCIDCLYHNVFWFCIAATAWQSLYGGNGTDFSNLFTRLSLAGRSNSVECVQLCGCIGRLLVCWFIWCTNLRDFREYTNSTIDYNWPFRWTARGAVGRKFRIVWNSKSSHSDHFDAQQIKWVSFGNSYGGQRSLSQKRLSLRNCYSVLSKLTTLWYEKNGLLLCDFHSKLALVLFSVSLLIKFGNLTKISLKNFDSESE